MIHLFTDFGFNGPYLGQMKAVLADAAPGQPVIDLMADAPRFAPKPAAYLLAALVADLPAGGVLLCVVDPGVGGRRDALAIRADGRIFIGPDNGLLSIVARRAQTVEALSIRWRPKRLSASFHGRDLFAPVAARAALDGWGALANAPNDFAPMVAHAAPHEDWRRPDWPDDLPELIYIDNYGNAMSGLRAASLPPKTSLLVNGRVLPRVRTFCDAAPGAALVYENSCGLLEIAVNGGDGAATLGLRVGAPVTLAVI